MSSFYSDDSFSLLNIRFSARNPPKLYEPIEYILQLPAKKTRPKLLAISASLFGLPQHDTEKIGTVVEVFHNFTLMHDDIMDNASLRRGNQCVHIKYGVPQAILSGDAMILECYDDILKLDNKYKLELLSAFTKMGIELCAGQQLDLDFEKMDNVEEAEYLKMIHGKTAVLLEFALVAPAILTNAPTVIVKALQSFGKYLGLAFQIQDDILDAFGTEEQLGKRIGGDILQNKHAILTIAAKKIEPGIGNAALKASYKSDEEKIAAIKDMYRITGALEYSTRMKADFEKEAMLQLKILESAGITTNDLKAILDKLSQRIY